MDSHTDTLGPYETHNVCSSVQQYS
jgi:hypothetical protein